MIPSQLVAHRGPASAGVIGEADKRGVRMSDFGNAVAQIVSEVGAVLLSVQHSGAAAARVIDEADERGVSDFYFHR
jgi:hypothetical protein